MKTVGTVKKIFDVKNSLGIALTGLVIFAVALAALILPQRSGAEWVDVEAKIKSIEEIQVEGAPDPDHEVTVEYTVHGRKYTEILPAYSSSWEVGDVVKCQYKADEPEVIQSAGGTLFAVIAAVIGLAALALGGLKTVRGLKKPSEEYDEHDLAKSWQADPKVLEELENSTEPAENLVFHYTGKLNQSYVMKNEAGEVVFEGNCRQMQVVRDTEYDFCDRLTGETELHRIGHTLTKSVGTEFGFSAPISSTFNIDGQDVWEWFASQGYGFKWHHKGISSIYEVTRWEIPIAKIEDAGTEIMGEKFKGKVGAKLPSKGLYRVTCRMSDVKAIFMLAFTLARIDLY